MSARKKAQATWGGRFSAGPAELMLRFGESVSFDRRLWAQDIRGSKAHATMLSKVGILTARECAAIVKGLDGIAREIARPAKATRPNPSHLGISYAVFCLKKKKTTSLPRHPI